MPPKTLSELIKYGKNTQKYVSGLSKDDEMRLRVKVRNFLLEQKLIYAMEITRDLQLVEVDSIDKIDSLDEKDVLYYPVSFKYVSQLLNLDKITDLYCQKLMLKDEKLAVMAKLNCQPHDEPRHSKDGEIVMNKDEIETELNHHIFLLHKYNDMKDTALVLLGNLAQMEGITTRQLYERYGLSHKD